MATFTRECFSGSTTGTPIAVTSTDSAGAATVHTASTNKEEIYLFGSNKTTTSMDLFTEFGDTLSPIVTTIGGRLGLVPVLPGLTLTGSKVVRVYGSTVSTSALAVTGWINRITP